MKPRLKNAVGIVLIVLVLACLYFIRFRLVRLSKERDYDEYYEPLVRQTIEEVLKEKGYLGGLNEN